MSRHSLAEAQACLPDLVARAAAGEEVVIETEQGHWVTLSPVPAAAEMPPPPEGGPALEAWFRAVRVGKAQPGEPDAAALVREMRDAGY